MGTNYYWRIKNCDKCGRYEDVHVGKSSAGWTLRDEYGVAVPLPLDWLAAKEPPDSVQASWEDDQYRLSPYYRPDPSREWRDDEGFRIYAEEFS